MIVQYGVLPYRLAAGGEAEILLITSRETRRWVIPRGNPIAGLTPPASGAQEALEEAGIEGETSEEELGSYAYDKRRRDGSLVEAIVRLFPMRVTAERDEWPERGQRERRWMGPAAAAEAVAEPELKRLILDFAAKCAAGGA